MFSIHTKTCIVKDIMCKLLKRVLAQYPSKGSAQLSIEYIQLQYPSMLIQCGIKTKSKGVLSP